MALFIHGCFQFGASMSGLFLNLYLWRLTESLWINGMFNVIVYSTIPLAFALGGWIAKKRDRMVTCRLGIGLNALFYIAVIIAKENVAAYYGWFALFNGIALGLYWTGYLVLMYDVSTERNRARFLGVNMIVFNFAGLAGPAVSGIIISLFEGLRGYIVTFSIACFMFALATVCSFRIARLVTRRKAYLLNLSGAIMKRMPSWIGALASFFILGLFQGTMLYFPNILLYRTFGREDTVGLLTLFFSLLTVLTGVYLSRRKNRSSVRRDLLISSAAVSVAAVLLLVMTGSVSVLLFMTLFSLFFPGAVNTLSSYYYSLMGDLPLRGQFRIESIVVREFCVNAGRVASIALSIVVATNPESPAIAVILVVTALMQVLTVWCVKDTAREALT